ncbi:ubiquinol-cytochrome C reductase cytochrome C subunit [Campylobacterota bacterium]|nr:ubiquinol-cytochrome C reductase cytochrome C subunit [Campylobacterota bacterium]
MKEIKILFVLILLTGAMYYGIEPYAHHIFNPVVKPADFKFSDLFPADSSPAAVDMERGRLIQLVNEANPEEGREIVQNFGCQACHTIKSAQMFPYGLGSLEAEEKALIEANGLLPPDLSNAASLYDEVYLIDFMKNPPTPSFTTSHRRHQQELLAEGLATGGDSQKLNTTFTKAVEGFDSKIGSNYVKMNSFAWLTEEQLASVVSFLRTLATPVEKLTPKEVTINACVRCHSIDYDHVPLAAVPKELEKYLGTVPPDLLMMIRSKGEGYLNTFINDPQKHLLGTNMPRVGLTAASQAKVVAYLNQVGDPKADERNSLGLYFVIYFLVLAVLAFAWKHNEFKEIGK